jgi:hypothetical protein
MARRIFTPEEANRTLPLVRRIVADIVSTHREIQRIHAEYHKRSVRLSERGVLSRQDREALDHRVQECTDQLHAYRRELRSIGCEMKDEGRGLIDFPGKMDGRDVCLCWMLGEEFVGFWHELDAGFAGRKPLPKAPARAEARPAGGERALDKRP